MSCITTIASDQKLRNDLDFLKCAFLTQVNDCAKLQLKVNLFAELPGKCCFVMSNRNLSVQYSSRCPSL